MKLIYIACIVCAILVGSAIAEETSDVLTLTSENFDETLAANPLILVEFYAPWCGHCKRLAPEYERAATMLKEKNIPIAKVDADEEINAPLRERFGIKGFPTIKLFRNGQIIDYEGERTAEAIAGFMKKQAQPAITSLSKSEDVTKFSSEDRVVIIGFFDTTNSNEYTTFTETANKFRDSFSFGEVIGQADVNKEFGVEKAPEVILFKQFDERKNILGSAGFSELVNFIKANSVPIIDEIGGHNYKLYLESGLPLAYIFLDLTVEGQRDQYIPRIQDIAKSSKGKLNFVIIDTAKYAKHAERLGLSGKTVPALAIEKMDSGTHYAFDEKTELTTENVQPWVNKFLTGELAPTIKSEDIPASNDGPVKVVVAKNWDQIVEDSSKDVLVEFYAPWCGHCKKLAPTFEELGTTFKDIPSVVIAKIDATANDVNPNLGIRGFPTIKLFPANNKAQPIDYNGDRSLEDMASFVKSQSSIKFELNQKDEL